MKYGSLMSQFYQQNLISKKQCSRNRVNRGNKRKDKRITNRIRRQAGLDLIMQEEPETFEIFSDLYSKRIDVLCELDFKGDKLEKLEVSRTEIDKVKELNNLSHLS